MNTNPVPASEPAKQLTAALGKLAPSLKPARRFAADLPVIGIPIVERLRAGVPATEIAKTIQAVYGYKISPERLARLVRPWRVKNKEGLSDDPLTLHCHDSRSQGKGGAS